MKKIPLLCLSVCVSMSLYSQKRLMLEEREALDFSNPGIPFQVDSIVYDYVPGMGTLMENQPQLTVERGDGYYNYLYTLPELDYTTREKYTGNGSSPLNLSGTGVKTYNASYQLIESTENAYRNLYTYDPNNGNLLQDEKQSFDGTNWQFEGRWQYSYDAQNRKVEGKTYFDFGQGIVLQFHDSLWYDGNSTNCSAVKFDSPNLEIKVFTTFSGDTPLSFDRYSDGVFTLTGDYYSSNNQIDSVILRGVNSSGIPNTNPSFSRYYAYNSAGKLISDSLYNHFYSTVALDKYVYDADNYLTEHRKYRTNPINGTEIFNEKNYKFTYDNVAGIAENSVYFTYYPNPTQNELVINTTDEIRIIAVYDMQGKIVLKQHFLNKVDVSHIPSGCYRVMVTTNAGSAETSFMKL